MEKQNKSEPEEEIEDLEDEELEEEEGEEGEEEEEEGEEGEEEEEEEGEEEEDGEDEDDKEEGEDEDEEPKLKYQRVGADALELLKRDASSCMVVYEKFLALGTHWGAIYILDLYGYEIKKFNSHTATVNELSIDASGDFIASCSDDGDNSLFHLYLSRLNFFFFSYLFFLSSAFFFSSFFLFSSCLIVTGKVVINALYTNETSSYSYKRPVKAVALDPEYSRKNSRQFCTGGLAGQLVLNEKGFFFSNKDVVLHAGEGPIYAIKWRGSLIAWANDIVYLLPHLS